ncbi:hypothetical protein E6P09_09995 [Haloferax mediterranei ATCC 33500]|uniref:Uncharacterized protein n=1 Tax=Haloferax mediterranei (strain ATCC 33500 / DSM 1411 / JCM 8866 / NBRC 14739 / NCIMB 2177 / R-4) TaxID=523841 RepID=I3R4E3_HALMT|nr:hypothetical protein [Haloferax mediterranei]AFK19103.1 hypothetical protein HFX_1393 [Haloferax mediterranei ATCC 33500]AHZ21536.1 hypothetical protein BM92_02200 [Haloferax mediterranei ATCC 33500]EMA03997.1 hypothetical protein C439_03528 [Haloferax mediterranei ATCC 33500]MDX5989198.1 hypothetical protein [Haloferax mediterranei ATCC 33500]QCQ75576.1 hypothetical protein E6P09_09995 [Haloferax mediterranei ATCC 33500]
MSSERFPSIDVTGDQQPKDVPFRLGIEKVRDFSSDEPARIRVSFENRASTEQIVGFGAIQPFTNIWCEGEFPIVLVPSDTGIQKYAFGTDEQIIPDRPVEGCWQTNLVRFSCNDVLRFRPLDVGETMQTEYTVLQYPEREILEATTDKWFGPVAESDVCLPAGKYRFVDSFLPRFRTDTTWDEFDWGFTLTIEE